jgi:hypothetical protein
MPWSAIRHTSFASWENLGPRSLSKEMQVQHETWAREAFRVLKPGSFILCAGGTRTYHRLDSGARQLTSLLPSTSAPCGVSC